MNIDILLFIAGLAGGAINAIAGGGGILMYPALLASGIPALTANATASLVVWPGALSSAYGYRDSVKKIPRYYWWLLVPSVIGCIIGSLTLIHTSSSTFERLSPWLVVFAVLLLAFQPWIRSRVEKRSHHSLKRHPLRVVFVICLLALPLSIYAGFFGVGYGIMMLAFLGFTNLKTIHQMNGLKNIIGSVMAIIATIYFAHAGLIHWHQGLVMSVGTVCGGFLGASLAQKVSSKKVHDLTVIIGGTIAIILLVQSYR